MNPTEKQITVSLYTCERCDTSTQDKVSAENCCLCSFCGKRPATAARKPHYYGELTCLLCDRARKRKAARGRLERVQARIKRLEGELVQERGELVAAQWEFAALYPPKKLEHVDPLCPAIPVEDE